MPHGRLLLPPCHAFLGSLFGGGAKAKKAAPSTTAAPPLEENLGEEKAEIVLLETQRPDGSAARILYRSGAPVVAAELEALCVKVGWPARPVAKVEAALQNSFLVASLHLQVCSPDGC